MTRLNLSKHAFIDLPEELPLNDEGKLNIIFQYRWHARGVPITIDSNIKAVVVFADNPNFNSGGTDELGTATFINKSIEKILKETKTELANFILSAYSGGGIGIYSLIKKADKLIKLPDGIVLSDANYGGKAVVNDWANIASKYLDEPVKKFILFHTRSLENNFNSTTKTAQELIKNLDIGGDTIDLEKTESSDFWKNWIIKPKYWTQKGGVIILDSPQATHAEAGKIVPQLLESFLLNCY